jgi:hypothetical protein
MRHCRGTGVVPIRRELPPPPPPPSISNKPSYSLRSLRVWHPYKLPYVWSWLPNAKFARAMRKRLWHVKFLLWNDLTQTAQNRKMLIFFQANFILEWVLIIQVHFVSSMWFPKQNFFLTVLKELGSSVSIVLYDRGSIPGRCNVRSFVNGFPAGLGIFLFTTASRPALGSTQPPIQWVPGVPSLGVKRPGRESDHSSPSSAEVKECVELYLHSFNTSPLLILCEIRRG